MQEIRKTIDHLYKQNKSEEAYAYLLDQFEQAMINKDDMLVLGILSELMGYYRVHAQFELGNKMAASAISILQQLQIEESVIAATTYLNIATLYRAQHENKQALVYFHKCQNIYKTTVKEQDDRFISLFNNMSLAYIANHQYEEALYYASKALHLLEVNKGDSTLIAITYTNIAQIYFGLKQFEKASTAVHKSIALFKQFNHTSPHYQAALATLAQLHFETKQYESALTIYKQVLEAIASTYGKNADYKSIQANIMHIQSLLRSKGVGLRLCKEYYETYGKPMLKQQFSHLLSQIAVGLIGQGSECLGMDDTLSQDHDFGPGFCIFVSNSMKRDDRLALQEAYDLLPKTFKGYTRISTYQGSKRVGVIVIEDFITAFIGRLPKSEYDWFYYEEVALLNLTNGELWDDYSGNMRTIRKQLAYYPENVRIKKIVTVIAKMAQSGQYNYMRCCKRNDLVACELALHEFITHTLHCLFLLNKQYKPFYKWSHKQAMQLDSYSNIAQLIVTLLAQKEEAARIHIIEDICMHIVDALQAQHLTTKNDAFLQEHLPELMNKITDEKIKRMHVMEG